MKNLLTDRSRSIPGGTRSYWIDSTGDTDFPSPNILPDILSQDIDVDTVVVGAGIAGLTAATLLKEAGQKVAVLDMGKIVQGVTGHTTAKITSLHGLIYDHLKSTFGLQAAQTYGEANQTAIEMIDSMVSSKNIDCDFKRTSAYTYTEVAGSVNDIKKEVQTAQEIGLPASFVSESPLPFNIKGAVKFDNQAQFHPRKYLLSLAMELSGEGSHVFENTRALNIVENGKCEIFTDKGKLRAEKVFIATHFPFYDKGFFYARLYPYYSYAAGITIEGEVPEGMYFTNDFNERSIRNQPYDGGNLLILSGGHHKTGQGGDTVQYYRDLLEYANERFDIKSVDYYWSTQDYDSVDSIPFIGKSPTNENVYVAAGFGGWGMSNGTLSGMIVSDLILGNSKKWSDLFDPSRTNFAVSARKLLLENIKVMRTYTRSMLTKPKPESLSGLAKGEGRIMNIDGERVGAYRDENDKIFIVSPICPHMRCVVNWNNAEKTWDCPCHGSRFQYDGELIHGPALAGLELH